MALGSRRLVVEIVGDARSLERSLATSSLAAGAFGGKLSASAKDARLWNSEVVRAGRGAIAASVGFSGLGRSVAFASAAFIGTAGLSTAIKSSVSALLQFQDTMQKSVGLAGIAQKQVASFTQQLLKLAPAVGIGPQKLAEALYFITSSGIPASKAMDVLTASAKAAVSGLGDVQTVADAVTSAMNAYATSNLSAKEATDVLVNAVRQGKGEADTLANSIGNVAAVASQIGVSFKDVGAALSVVTQLGVDSHTAGVELQQIFSTLLKTTPQAETALEAVGLSAQKLRDTFANRGLLAGLTQIRDAFKGNNTELSKAFPNMRAFRGILALVGQDANKTAAVFKSFGKSLASSTETAFAAISKSPEQRFRQLGAAVDVLKIRIGSALLPTIQGVTKSMVDWLSKTKNQEAVTKTLTSIVGGLVSVLRTAHNAVKTVTSVFGGWKTSIELVVGAWAAMKALNMGRSIVQWVQGVGSLISGLRTAISVWRGEMASAAVANTAMYTSMEAGAAEAAAANVAAATATAAAWKAALISTGWGALAVAAGIAAAYVITHWAKVKRWFSDFGTFMVGTFKAAWTAIKGIFYVGVAQVLLPVEGLSRGLSAALGWIPGIGGKIKAALGKVTTFIDDWRSKGLADFAKAGGQMGDAFGQAFGSHAQKAITDQHNLLSQAAAAAAGVKAPSTKATPPTTPSASETAAAAATAVSKGFTLPFRLQLAQAKAAATQTMADDIKVAREVRAYVLQVIPKLSGQKLLDAYGILASANSTLANNVKKAAKAADQFSEPLKLQLEQAKFTALGKPLTSLLEKMRSVAEKAIKSGKLGIQGQIDAWNQIASINDQLQQSAQSALGQFKQLNTKALIAGFNLTPEERKALRARLSQIGPGGTVPGAGVGAFGYAFNPNGTIQVNSTIKMDGKTVGTAVTNHQIKANRRNPSQRRGPNAGLIGG